jgi:hypothetical protein
MLLTWAPSSIDVAQSGKLSVLDRPFCCRSHQHYRTLFIMGGGKVIECNTKGEWDQHMSSGKTVRLQLCHIDAWPEILRVVTAFFVLSLPAREGAVQLY